MVDCRQESCVEVAIAKHIEGQRTLRCALHNWMDIAKNLDGEAVIIK